MERHPGISHYSSLLFPIIIATGELPKPAKDAQKAMQYYEFLLSLLRVSFPSQLHNKRQREPENEVDNCDDNLFMWDYLYSFSTRRNNLIGFEQMWKVI